MTVASPGDPDVAALVERIVALPGVEHLQAGEENGAPQLAWGDRFFFVGPDRRRPFATIVEHDVPGFDEDSDLARPWVYRLNLDLGREEFQRRFGYPPAALAEHRAGIDFTRLGVVLPHPAYGGSGWASVLNPTAPLLAEVDALLAHAHRRATARHRRSLARRQPGTDRQPPDR